MTPTIKLLEPDMPSAAVLLPLLERIDAARWYTNFGPLVIEFERALQATLFANEPLSLTTVTNGTVALELAVQVLALPEGSRVLVPTYTFPATLSAVWRNRLVPIFSDVDPDTWQLTPAIARALLTHVRFDLVMPVATFGNPVDADGWRAFMAETGVPVVVDAAAALGAQRIVPGPLFCFSMHATKTITCGEGGLVVGYDAACLDRVRRLSNFGLRDHVVDVLGTNGKMSEYHAAIGLAQLSRWPALRACRLALFDDYRTALADQAMFQKVLPGYVPSVLSVRLVNSAACVRVERALTMAGIEYRHWYSMLLHRVPGLRGEMPQVSDTQFPYALALITDCIGLPFHNRLSVDDVARIAETVRSAI